MKTLTLTTFRRPQYTLQVFQHLNNCAGIEDYTLFIQAEPNQILFDLISYFKFKCKTDVVFNARQLGCKENNLQVLERAFEHTDYNIHVEDDILMSRDALKYFEWGQKQREEKLFTIAGYSKTTLEDTTVDKSHGVEKEYWYVPWGWATWKENFKEMLKIRELQTIYTWDDEINRFIRGDSRYQLKPLLSRTQNIGSFGGSHIPSPEWHIQNQYNQFWIESVPYEDKEFYVATN